MTYFVFKILHLAGVILWIGPPLGAYLMQLTASKHEGSDGPSSLLIRRTFITVLTLEHVALVVLALGALGVLWQTNWSFLSIFWVQAKLALFVLVIIPVEVLDIWWGQVAPLRALRRLDADPSQDGDARANVRRIFSRYDRYVLVCIPILLVSWALFFWLAVAKPT